MNNTFFFEYESRDEYLAHHGVIGMHWGIRRYQPYSVKPRKSGEGGKEIGEAKKVSEKADILPAGSKVYRVVNDKTEPFDTTYDNKKYVSTTTSDQHLWEQYFGRYYKKYGSKFTYESTKDLKVARAAELGTIYAESSPKIKELMTKQMHDLNKQYQGWVNAPLYRTKDVPENVTHLRSIAMLLSRQKPITDKYIQKQLIEKGYDAVEDVLGWDVADNPIIVLKPEKKLKKVSKAKFTDAGVVNSFMGVKQFKSGDKVPSIYKQLLGLK